MSTEKTLRRGAALAGALAVTAMLAMGCDAIDRVKKLVSGDKADTTADAAAATTETTPVVEAPSPTTSGAPSVSVVRYPDETPESGTVATRSFAKVRLQADDTSQELSQLGAGTNVTRQARKGAYTLVMWPSAPGQLSPGWVPTSALSDTKAVAAATASAAASAAAATVVAVAVADAGAAAATDAGTKTVAALVTAVVDAGAPPPHVAVADAGAPPHDAGTTTAAAKSDGGGVRLIGAIAPPGGRPPGPITLPGKR